MVDTGQLTRYKLRPLCIKTWQPGRRGFELQLLSIVKDTH
jgi:hypothetical protein